MKTIFKFNLIDNCTISIPHESDFLCVQLQNELPMMWFEVDKTLKTELRRFKIVGTGWDFEGGIYRGTYQQHPFVWHVYEVDP